MTSKKRGNSEAKNQKWIAEGRGSGKGSDYKPWLTVRDLASQGRSHRIFGHKTQRTHHLLSDLELAVFLLLEWSMDTEDIREQFPLRLDDTKTLAKEAGIHHPSLNGVLQIMTSDFLVNTRHSSPTKFALQAKYTDALKDPRTIEKLEIERRYWQQKGIPWMLVTECEIPKLVIQNLKWLYPAQRMEMDDALIILRARFYDHHFQAHPELTIIDVGKQLDVAYELPAGDSLREIRQLLAKRCFVFDLFTSAIKLKGSGIELADLTAIGEVLHVSNQ